MAYPSTWVALVSAINTEVVARLAAAGYPALTQEIDGSAGKILLGSSFPAEFSSPPRVVFVPQPSKLEGPTRSVMGRAGMPAPEQAAMLSTRAIARMWKSFKVYCWACNFSDQVTPSPDPALDYDAADAMAGAVRSAMGWKPRYLATTNSRCTSKATRYSDCLSARSSISSTAWTALLSLSSAPSASNPAGSKPA